MALKSNTIVVIRRYEATPYLSYYVRCMVVYFFWSALDWGWMVASRVFVTLGLVALLLAILFLLLYVYVIQAGNVTLMLAGASCGAAGGFSECSDYFW